MRCPGEYRVIANGVRFRVQRRAVRVIFGVRIAGLWLNELTYHNFPYEFDSDEAARNFADASLEAESETCGPWRPVRNRSWPPEPRPVSPAPPPPPPPTVSYGNLLVDLRLATGSTVQLAIPSFDRWPEIVTWNGRVFRQSEAPHEQWTVGPTDGGWSDHSMKRYDEVSSYSIPETAQCSPETGRRHQ